MAHRPASPHFLSVLISCVPLLAPLQPHWASCCPWKSWADSCLRPVLCWLLCLPGFSLGYSLVSSPPQVLTQTEPDFLLPPAPVGSCTSIFSPVWCLALGLLMAFSQWELLSGDWWRGGRRFRLGYLTPSSWVVVLQCWGFLPGPWPHSNNASSCCA